MIKSRWMRLAGHAARVGEMKNLYSILVGKSEGKSPLGRTRCRWEGIMRKDLRRCKMWNGFIWLRIGISGGFL
jgi:hypothetical protein